jgi:hypothetical protein
MPISDFIGETFVAFLDISGFKEMMKDDQQAVKSLSRFYSCGYNVLQNHQNHINGFFVSDCGILFVRADSNQAWNTQLNWLLDVIKNLNRSLLCDDIMLTTSIAFGQFSYHQRIEFEGIEKNPVYGHAYVSAFLGNENGNPKIQPGQCRIIKKGLCKLELNNDWRIKEQLSHFYYYWMLDSEADIGGFEKHYKDAYQLKYSGMLKALKNNANG